MNQKFTSKNTSVNGAGNKIPALFHKIDLMNVKEILDYGCGDTQTYLKLSEYFKEKNISYVGIDKFHSMMFDEFLEKYKRQKFSIVTCSNVLNVIKEKDIRINEVIKNIYDLLEETGVAYFTVYEGNRTGVGKQSKKDCWQENRHTKEYISEIKEIFLNVSIKNKIIICKK